MAKPGTDGIGIHEALGTGPDHQNTLAGPVIPVVSSLSLKPAGQIDPEEVPELAEPGPTKPSTASTADTSVADSRVGTGAAHYINSSIERFLQSLQEPRYMTPLTGDEISDLFQAYYRELEQETLATSGCKSLCTAERRSLDSIERGLCTTLFDKLFDPPLDSHRAQRFEARLSALRSSEQLLDRLELDISPDLRQSLEPVIGFLGNIDKAKPPQDKLSCFVQVNKMIANVFGDTSTSGDAVLPALIYCVLASPATSLWRHTLYTRRYRRSTAIRGQYEYCLTNFEAAVHFLDTISFEDLPPGVDAALFEPRSRASSVSSRSRSNSTPIRTRIGSIGASLGASVSKYLFAKPQQQHPGTIAEVRRTLDSDTTSVSTCESMLAIPPLNSRFLNADPDSLSIGDVKQLLSEYKQLASYIQHLG